MPEVRRCFPADQGYVLADGELGPQVVEGGGAAGGGDASHLHYGAVGSVHGTVEVVEVDAGLGFPRKFPNNTCRGSIRQTRCLVATSR